MKWLFFLHPVGRTVLALSDLATSTGLGVDHISVSFSCLSWICQHSLTHRDCYTPQKYSMYYDNLPLVLLCSLCTIKSSTKIFISVAKPRSNDFSITEAICSSCFKKISPSSKPLSHPPVWMSLPPWQNKQKRKFVMLLLMVSCISENPAEKCMFALNRWVLGIRGRGAWVCVPMHCMGQGQAAEEQEYPEPLHLFVHRTWQSCKCSCWSQDRTTFI